MRLVVVGGGPAGVFAAISAASAVPGLEVAVLEREDTPLRRPEPRRGVPLLTRDAQPADLVPGYPRGAGAMEGWLHVWQPCDVEAWFAGEGVPLEKTPQGGIAPAAKAASKPREVLLAAAARLGVRIHCGTSVTEASATTDGFRLWAKSGPPHEADVLLLATGGQGGGLGYGIAQYFGHTIVPPLPSITLLHTRDARLRKLGPLDVPGASARISELQLEGAGGVSIQPQGLGGPAVLEITARGARDLAERDFVCLLEVNWATELGNSQPTRQLREWQASHPKRPVNEDPLYKLPARLWERLTSAAGVEPKARWSSLGNPQLQALAGQIVNSRFKIDGRSVHKPEWVTSGGVPLEEIDPQSMESRRKPGLFLCGEMLDIDGLPGGYNLQAAWTTARVAALGIAAMATR